ATPVIQGSVRTGCGRSASNILHGVRPLSSQLPSLKSPCPGSVAFRMFDSYCLQSTGSASRRVRTLTRAILCVLTLLATMVHGVAHAATVTFDVPPFAPFNGSNPPPPWNDTTGNNINAVSPGVFKGAAGDSNFYLIGVA